MFLSCCLAVESLELHLLLGKKINTQKYYSKNKGNKSRCKSNRVTITPVAFFILKLVDMMVGLRVDEDEETEGLDIVLHNERGYNI